MKKPANQKLYDLIVAQARAKYSNYPNPGASHWVHKQYVEHGGQFIETTEADRKKKMAAKKQAAAAGKKPDKKSSNKKGEKKK